MTPDAVTDKLTEVFHDVFGDDTLVLSRELTADQIDGWDSLTHVRLILSVERAFNTRLPSTKVALLKNVGDLLDLIAAHQKPGAAA
jgi:acyl carrier protein